MINKPQNLLVTLDSVDHVKIILANAKQLRNSDNLFVRNNMFINADLTKAEATVAYEERCWRRLQRESKRQPQGDTRVLAATESTSASSTGSLTVEVSSKSGGATYTVLNAAVPDFQPAASSRKPDSQQL